MSRDARRADPVARRVPVGRIALAGWLVVVWCLLWDGLSPLVVIGGVAVAALVLRVFPAPSGPPLGRFSPGPFVQLLGYLGVDLLVSSARVVWAAVRSGRPRLNAVVEVPLLHARSDAVMALIVNSIGVTPGSLVVEVDIDRGVMHLHQLVADTPAERDQLRRHVLRVEQLVLAALGTPDERAAVSGTGSGPGGGGVS